MLQSLGSCPLCLCPIGTCAQQSARFSNKPLVVAPKKANSIAGADVGVVALLLRSNGSRERRWGVERN